MGLEIILSEVAQAQKYAAWSLSYVGSHLLTITYVHVCVSVVRC